MSGVEHGRAQPVEQTERRTLAEVEVEEAFDDVEVSGPLVGVLSASQADEHAMQDTCEVLGAEGIAYEVRVMDPQDDAELIREYCHAARIRGLQVLIAGSSMSAALAVMVAAYTDLPVIAVPLSGSAAGGLDTLIASVQMPPGAAVASVALDGARNAGLLAARIVRTGT